MRTLRAASKHCYLLESAEDNQRWGRYSFLGYAPTLELTCSDGCLRIRYGSEEEIEREEQYQVDHPGEKIREILKNYRSPKIKGIDRKSVV